MLILSAPSAPMDTVATNLPVITHSVFRTQMLPELWSAASFYGVDPVGMVAQAGKETSWGNYPGKVKLWFHNTAGIKVRFVDDTMALIPTTDGDHALVHQQFPSWEVGALAHAQHLRGYCNAPVADLVVDPRYSYVIGRYDVDTWADLGGKWAPSPTYGTEIETIISRLRGE